VCKIAGVHGINPSCMHIVDFSFISSHLESVLVTMPPNEKEISRARVSWQTL